MTPRILNSLAVRGSASRDLTTDPPWTPVAPKTTTTLGVDIILGWNGSNGQDESCEEEEVVFKSQKIERVIQFYRGEKKSNKN